MSPGYGRFAPEPTHFLVNAVALIDYSFDVVEKRKRKGFYALSFSLRFALFFFFFLFILSLCWKPHRFFFPPFFLNFSIVFISNRPVVIDTCLIQNLFFPSPFCSRSPPFFLFLERKEGRRHLRGKSPTISIPRSISIDA